MSIFKTILIAGTFGASYMLDAFWIAYMLPNLFPSMLRGVLSTAFIPNFIKALSTKNSTDVWTGINTLFVFVLLLSSIAMSITYHFSTELINVISPGLPANTKLLASELVKLMSPIILIIAISSILTSISHSYNKFAIPSLESFITNTTLILCIYYFHEGYGIQSLAYGVNIGFFALLILLVAYNFRVIKSHFRFQFDSKHPEFRKPLAHIGPLTIGYAGAALITITDRFFASYMGEGAISSLTYATMLMLLPMEIFVQSIITSSYPTLSKGFALQDGQAIYKTYCQGMRVILLITIPITLFLVIHSTSIVQIIFERGKFDASNSETVSILLAILTASLLPRAIAYYNYRILHAVGKPWRQVKIGLLGVLANLVLNSLLYIEFGIYGVATATLLAFIQSSVLAQRAIKKLPLLKPLPFKIFNIRYFTEVLFLAIILAAIPVFVEYYFTEVNLPDEYFILSKIIAYSVGSIAFILAGIFVKNHEINLFYQYIKSKTP